MTRGSGIIPAHAGFTPVPLRIRESAQDHPRTRGVYVIGDYDAVLCEGSSPHTRGLPATSTSTTPFTGIIPAHAGFTNCDPKYFLAASDHPRTRGVYALAPESGLVSQGSSPHTRGLPDLDPRAGAERRIIPAHAGFTILGFVTVPASWDHPRTRGVYVPRYACSMRVVGSSPHTRGLPHRDMGGLIQRRIIPAHAGFTQQGRAGARHSADHPRTRGVYALADGDDPGQVGSSPHTRGLRGLGDGGSGR